MMKNLPWEAYGFTDIRTASSSPDAWELLTTGRIDACFIDIRMPVMSGLELLARARRQNLETLFVVVSGYSDFSYAKQAIQHGVLDYCLKPVSEEECRPVLEKLARQIPLNRISPDSAFASRLLADPDFCRDFLSGLHAAPGPRLFRSGFRPAAYFAVASHPGSWTDSFGLGFPPACESPFSGRG